MAFLFRLGLGFTAHVESVSLWVVMWDWAGRAVLDISVNVDVISSQ